MENSKQIPEQSNEHISLSKNASAKVIDFGIRPPLTDDEISVLANKRNKSPTPEEIKHMNEARAQGKLL